MNSSGTLFTTPSGRMFCAFDMDALQRLQPLERRKNVGLAALGGAVVHDRHHGLRDRNKTGLLLLSRP